MDNIIPIISGDIEIFLYSILISMQINDLPTKIYLIKHMYALLTLDDRRGLL